MIRNSMLILALLAPPACAIEFERVVIDDHFPGAYQVEVADVNGDRKPDLIAVGGGTCAWYENPSWTKWVVTDPKQTPGIISSATADLDGDGKAEIAIAYEFAMNQPKKGKLLLATQADGGAWKLRPIADVGSIHRLRWGDVDADKRPDLVVAPIFGPEAKPPLFNQDDARLVYYRTGTDPKAGGWKAEPIAQRPVIHAIEVRNLGNPFDDVLTADNHGVGLYHHALAGFHGWFLSDGKPGDAPKRGSSEVHLGRLKDGRALLATIEPWHGSEVVVRLGGPPKSDGMRYEGPYGPRTVIDDTLAEGHALWLADVDGDGDGEIFAGHRGKDHRVSLYDYDGKEWKRTVLDRDIAAQDLRGGDLDGDGIPDVVAVGGSTHNVVWYKPRARQSP